MPDATGGTVIQQPREAAGSVFMKMCYKCGKRPAVVFISDGSNPQAEPRGLCLVCAKESGIRPVTDLLRNMNLSDDDIEQMSDQIGDAFSLMEENSDGEDFTPGGAPAFPFMGGVYNGGDAGEREKQNGEREEKRGEGKKKGKKRRFMEQYCTNLNERARDGRLDRVIGRDAEMERVIQILSRRQKNNPCLIGEPGVGKTAIAEGLALRIVEGKAPARLLDKEIYLLDLTALVAGTQFRGQFESRVKGLIEEVKAAGNIILFIDEVHSLVAAGDSEGAMSAGNILKPALSRGEIQVIGATTLTEYRKYIEKDAALERRFQPVTVEEPSVAACVEILSGVRSYYEGYHGVTVTDRIVRLAVSLSERYISDRFLPDKAIDLLDEACACAALRNKAADRLYTLNKRVAELSRTAEELESDTENTDYERLANIKQELARCNDEASSLYGPASQNAVTEDDLAKVIELWTGIPAGKVREGDLTRLKHLSERIKEKVVGQDEAVDTVAMGVRRNGVQISSHRRPASFIFVGPTGVGKTYLVKVLSEQLFDSPETFIRLDMSEFMEKHAVSRLIGAPPGYIGYDDAGQLTEKVRRKPYSVILFDEIEKAHPDVLNVLLQILDDGRITDAQGRTVNFENTVIVMTSNAGSDRAENPLGFGKTEYTATREKAMKALEQFLRPEFLGRVDDIIVFNPLGEEDRVRIAGLILDELKPVLAERGITLSYTGDALREICKRAGSVKRGARDLRRAVRREVEDPIINEIVERGDGSFGKVTVTGGEGGLRLLFED